MQEVGVKIKVQTEGQQQLAATKDAVMGVADSVRKADAALGSFDASNRRLSPAVRQVRKEIEDTEKAAEKYIKTLERGPSLPPPLPKEAAESSIASLAKIGLQFEVVRRLATTAASEIGDAITKADQVSRLDRTLTRLSGGNKTVGVDLRRRIQDVAIESQAFDFDSAREAAQRLAAFKLPLQELPGILTAIGDKASEIGRDKIPAIVRALGQINVKGRVQAEELLQLQEAGIDATATLAKGFGLTTQNFLKQVEKGIIPAREAIRLLINDMRTGAGKDIPEVGAKVDQLKEKYDRFKSDFAAEFVNPPLLRLLENTNTLLDHLIKKGREFAATFDKDRGAGATKGAVTASLTAATAANPLTAAIAIGGAIINSAGERLKVTPRTTSQDLANAARYGAFDSAVVPLKPYANAESDAKAALERESRRVKSEREAAESAKQAVRNAKQVADDIERIEERAVESQLNRADKLRAQRDKEVRDLTRLGATRAQIDRARLAYTKLISEEETLIANRAAEAQRESFAKLAQEIEQAATRARDKASNIFSDKLGKSIAFDEAEVRRLTRVLNQDDDFATGAIERRSNGARRLSDALAPIGGEKAAALANLQLELDKQQQILSIRLNGAQRIQDAEERSLRIAELREAAAARADEARLETAARLIELDKQRSERYREDAGRVFDAITSRGGGGLRDFIGGFVKQQERAVFQNISQGIFEKAGGILGKVGQASGLGGLLRGTIFEPQNAQTPEMRSREKNTLAIEKNTEAIQGRVSITGNPGIDSILSQLPGATPPFAGSSRSGGGFLSGIGSLFSGGLFRGLRGGDYSVTGPDGRTTTASALGLTSTSGRVGNVVGSAALVGAGTYGIVSGVKQGGAQGALTAVQGGLSIAAAVPGPQQPFIQAAALVAGLVKGLFPDSKQQRENEIRDEVATRKYNGPSAIDRVEDRDGNAMDYDANGNLRRAGGVTIIQNISTVDSKSWIDHKDDILNAAATALLKGNEFGKLAIQKSVFGVA